MTKVRLPKSVKKYIRREKMRIRRETSDLSEQEKQIQGLIERFYTDKPAPVERKSSTGQAEKEIQKPVKKSESTLKKKPNKQSAFQDKIGKAEKNKK